MHPAQLTCHPARARARSGAADRARSRHRGPHPCVSAGLLPKLNPQPAARGTPASARGSPGGNVTRGGGEQGGASRDQRRATADDVRARARRFSSRGTELRKELGSDRRKSRCCQTELGRAAGKAAAGGGAGERGGRGASPSGTPRAS